jgi:RimJ/RimL family protein N-acetyltransferase
MLRPLVPEDAEALQALSDDPAVAAAIPFIAQPFTLAAAHALIGKNGGGQDCFLGLWQRSGEALVGVVGLHLRGVADLEIGYRIGSSFRGQGYASEAGVAALELVGAALPRRRVIAECRPENLASWRVLEKLGFRPTGEAGTRPGRRLLVRAAPLSPS